VADIVTRCGYRCDLCLAYKGNIGDPADQEKISDGWFRCYGFRIPPEGIRCDGCLTPDRERPNLVDKRCPVRACVLEKGLENCAHCGEYVCEKLAGRIVSRAAVEAKLGRIIPEQDYRDFVRPYESRPVLDALRRDLGRA